MNIVNTTVTVRRGSSVDSYGDRVLGTTTVYTGIPAAVHEVSARQRNGAEWVTTRTWEVRVAVGVELKAEDTLTTHEGHVLAVLSTRSSRWSGCVATCEEVTQ